MTARSLLVFLPLLLACSPQSGQPAHATGAHTEVHAAGAANPVPAGGWASDAPLREGMGRIRLSVDALRRHELGQLGVEQAMVMAGNVEKDVNFLIANCKLDPEADAALHGIIAKLLKGAHALKANPSDTAAIAPMREALADYAARFDDPGFRSPAPKP